MKILAFILPLLISQISLLGQDNFTKIIRLDSIHSIERNFDTLGTIISYVEMRKFKPCGKFFSYHQNGLIKSSGSHSQVIDTLYIATEDLTSGEITYSPKIVDYSPRKVGHWLTFDTLGRVIKLERFANSWKSHYLELYNYDSQPFITIRKGLDTDTIQNSEYSNEHILLKEYETLNDSLCGEYFEYHSNGKLKLEGRYAIVPSGETAKFSEEDLLTGEIIYYEVPIPMSTKTGIWHEYDETGNIIKSDFHQ